MRGDPPPRNRPRSMLGQNSVDQAADNSHEVRHFSWALISLRLKRRSVLVLSVVDTAAVCPSVFFPVRGVSREGLENVPSVKLEIDPPPQKKWSGAIHGLAAVLHVHFLLFVPIEAWVLHRTTHPVFILRAWGKIPQGLGTIPQSVILQLVCWFFVTLGGTSETQPSSYYIPDRISNLSCQQE